MNFLVDRRFSKCKLIKAPAYFVSNNERNVHTNFVLNHGIRDLSSEYSFLVCHLANKKHEYSILGKTERYNKPCHMSVVLFKNSKMARNGGIIRVLNPCSEFRKGGVSLLWE